MVLRNKGFSRLVIILFIIYGSTHAKNLVIGSIDFSLKSLKYNTGKKILVMTILQGWSNVLATYLLNRLDILKYF